MFRIGCVLRAKDPFKVLGLTRSATKAQVKAKFRELAKQHHPDAAHGDSTRMEEINRAHNLLLKEGAFERLHLSGNGRPAAGSAGVGSADIGSSTRNYAAPFARDESVGDSEDYTKISALDSETERVTPGGKYMYQNRDTGMWVTLDKPLVRANQPRYRSFSEQAAASGELQEELRRRRDEQEKMQNAKTAFERTVEGLNDGSNLPTRNKYGLMFAAAFTLMTAYFVTQKGFEYNRHKRIRYDYYHELNTTRASDDELYERRKNEVETLIAAAALVVAAAARRRVLDGIVTEGDAPRDLAAQDYYAAIIPPKKHFEVVSGN
ncbi:DNA-J chaperone, putative [Bodo saltans]|uniref:DNA-J chaperone, putative n=1 Tax=Bodo saltans TaxID=75058 RepID=A0A0S4IL99_BODSA|nr:DNA-J chaperone, putative [Bodo saltans]|eukprot:CUF23573.1 DNA-J chaperone, putative [Bodo saltans]